MTKYTNTNTSGGRFFNKANGAVQFVVILLLCGCASGTKNDGIPPSFYFDYDNCVSVLDNSKHQYHQNNFIVTGCSTLLEQGRERQMWEQSNHGP